jgi:hypothetical protein
MPRAPGLYHTSRAYSARDVAEYFIIPSNQSTFLPDIDDASKSDNYMKIFDPYGKSNMIEGGIGCVRLKCKDIDGEKLWLMSASSTRTAHEGFPVALPDYIYTKYIEQINNQGALNCTLIGKLEFLPNPEISLFRLDDDIPQLYLLIDELIPENSINVLDIRSRVSVAVSFESEYEGHKGVYSSYVTFFPGVKNSFRDRIEWLENIYVDSMYQGRIITNFDEQKKHFGQLFNNAILDIEKVMKGQLEKDDIKYLFQLLRIQENPFVFVDKLYITVGRLEMKTERIINIGNNNSITAPVIIADQIENSFNASANSNIDSQVKDLLQQLVLAVNDSSKSANKEQAETMARDVESLTKEVTSSKPRREWYEVSVKGLQQAAENIGKIGEPILKIVGQLLPLLIKLYPH